MFARPAVVFVLIGLLFFCAGCTPTRTYEVMVINDADDTVTAWMSKRGGPAEINWLSPSQVAILFDPSEESQMELPSAVLAPGDRVRFGPRKGKFPRDAAAVIEVYEGEMPLSEMISLTSRSPRRGRLTLSPGENLVRVTSVDPVELRQEQRP